MTRVRVIFVENIQSTMDIDFPKNSLNPSALVGYLIKKRFLCVSVICGKASFPDQRIDLELLSAGRRRVSFSALGASQQCGAFLFFLGGAYGQWYSRAGPVRF